MTLDIFPKIVQVRYKLERNEQALIYSEEGDKNTPTSFD